MKKVGEITHIRSGIAVSFFLDKTNFVCSWSERHFSAPDAKTLEARVLDAIEHSLQLEWYPVICVDAAVNDGWGSSKKTGLWLTMERMYLSRSPTGMVLRCAWDIEPAHRKAVCGSMSERELRLASLPLGAPLKIGLAKTWMDYTEAKWQNLMEIQAGIDRISETLRQLLTTSAGNAQLESPEFLLPGAGEKLLLK